MINNHFEAVYALMSPSRVIVGDGAFGRETMAQPSERDIQSAQVWATMALAHEQRTATLIALWSKPQVALKDIHGNPMTYSIDTDMVGELLQEILERLGADK